MSTLFEFSQAIRNLNKEKKFSETLKFFKDNKTEFKPENIGLNKFVVYEMISALIETNHYDVIFTFIEKHNVVLDEKNFGYLLKKFKDKPSVNWTVVNKFCDLVSVDNLDTECKTIEVVRKGEKKPMELASDKENWFSFKTKALFETHQYQDCFELSKKALETFDKFHYSNDVWFARRVALSKRNLGNTDDTIQELETILKKKSEWFIQKELAELYLEKGNVELAFKMAINAINNFGSLEFKVNLLFLIGKILKQQDKLELSFKHFSLSRLIRLSKENGKIPQKLFEALRSFSSVEIPITDLKELKNELQKYWDGFKSTPTKTYHRDKIETNKNFEGEIVKILHENERGKDGFINCNGKEYYFSVNPNYLSIYNIVIGTKVLFKILPSTETKKEQTRILKIVM